MYGSFIFDKCTWKPYGLELGGTHALPNMPCAWLLTDLDIISLLENCVEFACTTCTEPKIVTHNNMIIILLTRFIQFLHFKNQKILADCHMMVQIFFIEYGNQIVGLWKCLMKNTDGFHKHPSLLLFLSCWDYNKIKGSNLYDFFTDRLLF